MKKRKINKHNYLSKGLNLKNVPKDLLIFIATFFEIKCATRMNRLCKSIKIISFNHTFMDFKKLKAIAVDKYINISNCNLITKLTLHNHFYTIDKFKNLKILNIALGHFYFVNNSDFVEHSQAINDLNHLAEIHFCSYAYAKIGKLLKFKNLISFHLYFDDNYYIINDLFENIIKIQTLKNFYLKNMDGNNIYYTINETDVMEQLIKLQNLKYLYINIFPLTNISQQYLEQMNLSTITCFTIHKCSECIPNELKKINNNVNKHEHSVKYDKINKYLIKNFSNYCYDGIYINYYHYRFYQYLYKMKIFNGTKNVENIIVNNQR